MGYSKSEAGAAKLVEKLRVLIERIKMFQADYDPANPHITLPALEAAFAEAELVMLQLSESSTKYRAVVNERKEFFKEMEAFAKRIFNMLKASGAPADVIAKATVILRKIRGASAQAKKNSESGAPVAENVGQPTENAEDAAIHKSHSTSQQSYEYKRAYFGELVQLVINTHQYATNEADLQPAALLARFNEYGEMNASVATAHATYKTAIYAKHDTLGANDTGIVNRINISKSYIKAKFGDKSSQAKSVKDIQVSRLRQ